MEGLRNFVVTICVKLHEPLPIADGEEDRPRPIVGYYRSFAALAHSGEQAEQHVYALVDDGTVDREEISVTEVPLADYAAHVQRTHPDATKTGVWYTSGRACFQANDND